MPRYLLAIVLVLAVWRVTHLAAAEAGPWEALSGIRRYLGFENGLACFDCTSLWVAIPAVLVLHLRWEKAVLAWLALSAAAMLLDRWVERGAARAQWRVE